MAHLHVHFARMGCYTARVNLGLRTPHAVLPAETTWIEAPRHPAAVTAFNLHLHFIALESFSNAATYRSENKNMGELIDKAKGNIKKAAGAIAGDKKLENEGKVDQAKGNVKGAFEDAKQAVKQAVKK